MCHSRSTPGKLALNVSLTAVWALLAQVILSQSAQAQTVQPTEPSPNSSPPTVRYARGEDIDLADIIAEWRGYYDDIPVYLCVCQDGTCDQTEQWPYREYDRYQLGLALGPNNGKVAEAAGSNCFDIADGSRPSEPRSFSADQTGRGDRATTSPPTPPNPPTAQAPVANSGVPTATTVNNGAAIRLDWPSGASNVINVTGSNWNINVLNALDCSSFSLVEQKMFEAQRVVGSPAVDSVTGNVAVPVLLSSCADTDQSAVFVLDPNEGGGYSLYRAQLEGNRTLPNEFASYPFSSITGLHYWDGSLFVRQGTASGAEAVMIFRPGNTPAGEYAGCGVVSVNEGANVLCAKD
ncbi:MAG: hypothetical protein WA885_06505 [Phormidesmis sp.]